MGPVLKVIAVVVQVENPVESTRLYENGKTLHERVNIGLMLRMYECRWSDKM